MTVTPRFSREQLSYDPLLQVNTMSLFFNNSRHTVPDTTKLPVG